MNVIEVENQYYILASSSLSDNRTEVLKHGETFGVFDLHGDIYQIGQNALGIYHEGTRFLSGFELNIEGQRALLLSSNKSENNEIHAVDLTNPDFFDKTGEMVLRGTIHILRNKFLLDAVVYERIRFINFGNEEVNFNIELKFNADYSDIFEARGTHRVRRGEIKDQRNFHNGILLGYTGLDKISRDTRIEFQPAPFRKEGASIYYEIRLNPKEEFSIDLSMACEINSKKIKPQPFDIAIKERENYNSIVKVNAAEIYVSNDEFNNWLNRSKVDMIIMVTQTDQGPYPYAGIPWYSIPFGRDGIITAFECLWVEPVVSKGVLQYLAYHQALEENDFQDAEIGRASRRERT